jgi:predicted transcriptional regulator
MPRVAGSGLTFCPAGGVPFRTPEFNTMPKPPAPQPTTAELAILKVLWRRGQATVREVWEDAGPDPKTGYTTVLKLLQIMTDKGLVLRDERLRTHVYRAAGTQEQTQRRLVGDLLERAFEGSAAKLVMQALSTRRATPQELAQIRELLDGLSDDATQPTTPTKGERSKP